MAIEDELAAIAATEVERMARLAAICDWDTAGPLEAPDVAPPVTGSAAFDSGWYLHARQAPAFHSRIGGPIRPFAVVAHTCDMLPGEFRALISAVTSRPGRGNAFHFAIGPTEADGIVQVAPIDRNANHAGGAGHGVFVDELGKTYHPNLVSIGIELHTAGGVRLVGGQWRLVENGKAHGPALPAAEVTPDPRRPGRGWHKATAYQLAAFDQLLGDLEAVLAPAPPGLVARSRFELAPPWAVMPPGSRVVGHVTLDAARRSDPWPRIMAWIRQRKAR